MGRYGWIVVCFALVAGCGDDSGSEDNNNQNNNNQNNNQNPLCGNGVVDGNEECDDGEQNSDSRPDACRSYCLLAACGDGVLDTNEECDEGYLNSDVVPDRCRSDCTPPGCGDGVVDLLLRENCEDGNTESGDGCSEVCREEYCGNWILDPGEVCDDNNHESGDGCSPNCLSNETCGNGRPDFAAGETCDCGDGSTALPPGCTAFNGDPTGSCTADCQALLCGNGVLDGLEVCDDGNNIGGDGCSPDCLSDETCGNGRADHQTGEWCDCGTDPMNLPEGCVAVNGDPAGRCGTNCVVRYCGNGEVDPGEMCDDENQDSGDGCSANCRSDETCGNGYVDTSMGETCDDGNLQDGDGCRANCTLETCGDGVVGPGEGCDDGNQTSGDGCSEDCLSTEICGNGYIDEDLDEMCDDGNTVGGDGCSANCLSTEICGNGYADTDLGEACDGDDMAGETCVSLGFGDGMLQCYMCEFDTGYCGL